MANLGKYLDTNNGVAGEGIVKNEGVYWLLGLFTCAATIFLIEQKAAVQPSYIVGATIFASAIVVAVANRLTRVHNAINYSIGYLGSFIGLMIYLVEIFIARK